VQASIKEVINERGDDIDGHCSFARCLALAAADVVSPIACPRNGSSQDLVVVDFSTWWWISA
jgi:hypothetical protein